MEVNQLSCYNDNMANEERAVFIHTTRAWH